MPQFEPRTHEDIIYVTKTVLPDIAEYVKYLEMIWSRSWVTNNGELVQLLAVRLEEFLGVENIVLLSNGTSAIDCSLKVLGLTGEVITTPFTFAATTNSLIWNGLKPVFADIDPTTFNIDPSDVESKITGRTRAIVAVHVYGNPCDVEALQSIVDRHDLRLIYDAAAAFGVEYAGRSVLEWGDMSTLSFHATKVFSTAEGGAVVCGDADIVARLEIMRNHGIESEEEVSLPGTNAKMSELQAAFGLCNLETIEESLRSRHELYERYLDNLANIDGLKFQTITASRYNYAYMPVCFADIETRDAIYGLLADNGVKARKYFFPLTARLRYFSDKGVDLVEEYGLRNASSVSDGILCLPLYPDLDVAEVDRICDLVSAVVT
jgi:dTDP-4-amino-4,6-dideoxygalactose transaminase